MQATRQLVEQDKVFAIFNSLGTEHNVAIRDLQAARRDCRSSSSPPARPPSAATSSSTWTIGTSELPRRGWIYGTYLARTKPGAKVGVLFQNDDYGKIVGRAENGDRAVKVKVVAAPKAFRRHRPGRAVADLEAEGVGRERARALRDPRHAIQGYVFANRLGWRPLIINNALISSASNIMLLAAEAARTRRSRTRSRSSSSRTRPTSGGTTPR